MKRRAQQQLLKTTVMTSKRHFFPPPRFLSEKDTTSLANYHFYRNMSMSTPFGDYIDNIHRTWKGKYDLLERHHGYIQWLFPIRERGMNDNAQPLTRHEAELMRTDADIQCRFIASYELMLDFFGITLTDAHTGSLARAQHFQSRYAHLNASFHNYLRVTRILKSLGIVGLEHLKEQFVRFMVHEVFEHHMLPNTEQSLVRFWIPTCRRLEYVRQMDSLVLKLSNGRRRVDREGPDGWGDEAHGEPNWATRLYDQKR